MITTSAHNFGFSIPVTNATEKTTLKDETGIWSVFTKGITKSIELLTYSLTKDSYLTPGIVMLVKLTTSSSSIELTGEMTTGGVNMNENVPVSTFNQFEKAVIHRLECIEKSIENLADKKSLEHLKTSIIDEVEKIYTKKVNSAQRWIIGTLGTIIAVTFGFLIFNPDKAIKILEILR